MTVVQIRCFWMSSLSLWSGTQEVFNWFTILEQILDNMINLACIQHALKECILSASLNSSTALGAFWSQYPYVRRKALSRSRSAAVQKPDHAEAQYNSRDSTIARKTPFNDVSGIPWLPSMRIKYRRLEHIDISQSTWSLISGKRLFVVNLSTRSMPSQGGGSCADFPLPPTICLDVWT